jgi:hypothetical protein
MADTAEIELRDTVLALVGHFDKQHLEEYAALFSEDTDWENAFGWRLRGRRRLKEFLGQFLWPIQAGSKFGPMSYRAEFLFPDVALVEYSGESHQLTVGWPNDLCVSLTSSANRMGSGR